MKSWTTELLEIRRLFAVTLNNGVLSIIAEGGGNDAIIVALSNDGSTIDVNLNADASSHDVGDVSEIRVLGRGGNDLITIAGSQAGEIAAAITVRGGGGIDLIQGSGAAEMLRGGAGDDIIRGGGGGDDINGNSGRDVVNGQGGNDMVNGGLGRDVVRGGGGNDTIDGGSGADRLIGGGGADLILGGDGIDTADYSDRTEDLHLGIGIDPDDGAPGEGDNIGADVENLIGGSGNDTLEAIRILTPQNNTFFGGPGDDFFRGGTGDDVIFGRSGDDNMRGGAGNDRLDGGTGGDIFFGGDGIDTADYSRRSANLRIGIGTAADDGARNEGDNVRLDIENVIGGSGNDRITAVEADGVANRLSGRDGNDILIGGSGADVLLGGAGDDIIRARDGQADIVRGGAGNDDAEVDDEDDVAGVEDLL